MTPALGLELVPGVPQCLCKVVVHRTCDGHRVGHRLCFFVVFAQAAAEVFLNHGVACRVCCGDERGKKEETKTKHLMSKWNYPVSEDRNSITIGLLLVSGGAAIHVTVGQVAVTAASRGAGDNRGTILWVKKTNTTSKF